MFKIGGSKPSGSDRIINEIVNATRKIDSEVDKQFSYGGVRISAIFYHPEFMLRLERRDIDIRNAKVFRNIYHNPIVALPELGIIRSIRYSGEYNIPIKSFKVDKLKIGKSGTRLGHELLGSLITEGRHKLLENMDIDTLCSLSITLNMIRPFFMIAQNGKPYVLPSPPSLTSLKFKRYGNNITSYLTPASVVALIDYSKGYGKRLNVLGEDIDCTIAPAYVISCKQSIQRGHAGLECVKAGAFPTITPHVEGLGGYLREYANIQRPVVANVLGLWVSEKEPLYSSAGGNGTLDNYLLVLDEYPYYLPEVEAMAIFGECRYVEVKYEYKKLCLYLRAEKRLIEAFRNQVSRIINDMSKNARADNAIESYHDPYKIEDRFLWKDQDYVYMLPPQLIRYGKSYVMEIEKKLGNNVSPIQEILNIFQDHKLREVVNNMSKPMKVWDLALNNFRSIMRSHQLSIII